MVVETAGAGRAYEALSGPTGKKYALLIVLLTSVTGLTGNFLLCMFGLLTGIMLLNGPRASGPLMPLSMFTAVLASVQLVFAMMIFFAVLSSTPQRFCERSSALVEYATGPRAVQAPPYDLAYPWNMTESARPDSRPVSSASATQMFNVAHQRAHLSLFAVHTVACPIPPVHLHATSMPPSSGTCPSLSRDLCERVAVCWPRAVNEIACGRNSGWYIVAMGLAVLFYALCILTPLIILSLRVCRYARATGGCDDYGYDDRQQYAYVVPAYQQRSYQQAAVGVPVRQPYTVNGAIPEARVVQPGGQQNVPIANGRPMHAPPSPPNA